LITLTISDGDLYHMVCNTAVWNTSSWWGNGSFTPPVGTVLCPWIVRQILSEERVQKTGEKHACMCRQLSRITSGCDWLGSC
jgi:hypothetical protein